MKMELGIEESSIEPIGDFPVKMIGESIIPHDVFAEVVRGSFSEFALDFLGESELLSFGEGLNDLSRASFSF
jgi:hypothetical protein